ncbi:hypothetical protein JRO89_XS01G0139400 [Xanthoceras sorbifolium]|uniref:Uncharacterized protein n=1 Tax=Xanthoceras sorbifolium TaxID=99658 RepID=A0ABQ8IJ98_9ROSI|nr:hypothetical protein JRO89_XS01G0139400 [Xanthoceras sorbifolium]
MVSSGGGGGAAVEGAKGLGGPMSQSLKKGPWTAAEDAILMEYVKKHGEGNWNAVQKNSGLMRCGKSCRLRWANHLRPNLKKGSFSPDEERIIIELHAKLGNKWARMAAQASSYYSNPNHQFNLYCTTTNTNNMNTGFSVPLSSPASPYPPSSAGLFNQNIQTQAIPFQSYKFDSGNFERVMSYSSMITGASIDPIDFVPGQTGELPSSQTPPQPTTPSSGSSGGGVCVTLASGNTTNNNNVDYKTALPKSASTNSNSGLLDALVQESHNLSNLSRNNLKLNCENNFSVAAAGGVSAEKGKGVADYVSSEEGGVESIMKKGGDANANNQWEDLSSSQSSIGMKHSEEEMNSMDEDLMSLLNNFPISMPLPEWYPAGSSNISNASSSSITAGSNVESATDQPNVPPTPPPAVASPEIHWSQLGSYSWNNMPGIC